MRSRNWNAAMAGLLLVPTAMVARAETYLTEDQAASVLFPGVKMDPLWVDLSPADMKQINKAAPQKALDSHFRVWWGPNREAIIFDRVVGKHEFISYAVGIKSDGQIKGIEIIDYRETYGYQIRDKSWRDHFVGKSLQDPLKLNKDIPNISGATLSSKHVTEGVKRVLLTYDLLKNKA